MRKLGALAGAAALAVSLTGAGAARADHRPKFSDAVVEGRADYRTMPTSGLQIVYSCSALTQFESVASTSVACQVTQGEEVKSSIARAGSSNYVFTEPQVVGLTAGPFQICWTAYAWTTHGEVVYDATEPNCIVGEAVAS